jgi:mannose/fructose/N-acetylgalactosamine-specific phosphotransferase system component IIC
VLATAILYAVLQEVWVHLTFAQAEFLATHRAVGLSLDAALIVVYLGSSAAAGVGHPRWVRATVLTVGSSVLLGAGFATLAGYVFQREAMFPDLGFFAQTVHSFPALLALAAVAAILALGPGWLSNRLLAWRRDRHARLGPV